MHIIHFATTPFEQQKTHKIVKLWLQKIIATELYENRFNETLFRNIQHCLHNLAIHITTRYEACLDYNLSQLEKVEINVFNCL